MWIMKRRWRVKVVFGSLSSSQHLWVVKSDECRREMLRGRCLLITSEKSIWRCSIEHLIVQLLMVRRINLFTKRSFFRHFQNFFSSKSVLFYFFDVSFKNVSDHRKKESSWWMFRTVIGLIFRKILISLASSKFFKLNKHIFRTTFRYFTIA